MCSKKLEKPSNTIEIEDLLDLLPHRYPILMIDRIEDVILGESATGIKNVSINEPFFQGHFPNQPVFPGVLVIEAMAQTAAALVVRTLGAKAEGKLVYFMSIENARFRKPVKPGDQISVFVNKKARRANVWKFSSTAKVKEEIVAEATYSAMIEE